MNITLTTFIDFVIATPGSKVGVVREARQLYEEGYKPERDYYKGLRDGIASMHRRGSDASDLRRIVSNAAQRKVDNYQACADGYAKFMGRKRFVWVRTPAVVPWTSGPVEVSVNPELRVAIDGASHAIKLYFKAETLSKTRINTMLYLLRLAVPDEKVTVGILDTRRGKLVKPTTPVPYVDLLVRGEAASFAEIWRGLDLPALSAVPPREP